MVEKKRNLMDEMQQTEDMKAKLEKAAGIEMDDMVYDDLLDFLNAADIFQQIRKMDLSFSSLQLLSEWIFNLSLNIDDKQMNDEDDFSFDELLDDERWNEILADARADGVEK